MNLASINQTVVDAGVVPAVQSRLSAFAQYMTSTAQKTLAVGATAVGVLALAVSANMITPSDAHAQSWSNPGWGAPTGWGSVNDAINNSAKKQRQAQVINSATQLGAMAMGASPMESGLTRLAGEAAGALSNDSKVVQNTALGGAAALAAIYFTRDNKGQQQPQQNVYGNNQGGSNNGWATPSGWGSTRQVQQTQQQQQGSLAYAQFQQRAVPLYQDIVRSHLDGNTKARDDSANIYFMTVVNASQLGVQMQQDDRRALMEVVRVCPQVAAKYGVGMDRGGNVVVLNTQPGQ